MKTLLNMILTPIIMFVALLPAWFFVGLKSALNPDGFWEKFVLYGVGIYFLGAIQVIMAFGGIVLIVALWLRD